MTGPFPLFLAADRTPNPRRKDAAGTVATPFPDPVGQSAGTWRGAFRDEFTTSIDWTKWSWHLVEGAFYQSNDNNEEVEGYTRDHRGLTVAGGVCSLIARKENPYSFDALLANPLPSGNAGTYTSGMIQSHPQFNITAGYVEAKVKHPAVATGTWPAFWLSSSDTLWQAGPEIDCPEWFSGGTVSYNVFYETSSVSDSHGYAPDGTFHTYGCKFTAAGVTFYVDGVQVSTTTQHPTHLMHIVFNYAVQSTATFTGPSSFDIDYVRAWVVGTAPAAPVISTISPSTGIPSAGSITVNFGAVAGASSYRVTAAPVDSHRDGNAPTVHLAQTGSSSPITITGLTNGKPYNVCVEAINASGDYSEASAIVPAWVDDA